MSEPVKVLSMAKLLRLAREKEERERANGAQTEDALAATDAGNPTPAQHQSDQPSINHAEDLQSSSDQMASHETMVSQNIPPQTIPNQTIPSQTIPHVISAESPDLTGGKRNIEGSASNHEEKHEEDNLDFTSSTQTIPQQTIVGENPLSQGRVTRKVSDKKRGVDATKGYYPVFNDISDRLIPEMQLDPYEQAVLQRLYRLSRGWKREECEVGLGTLAKQCVMSRSQVQRSIAKLIEKELIENLGSTRKGGKEGNRYRVLAGVPVDTGRSMQQKTRTGETIVRETIPEQAIPSETIVTQEMTMVRGGTEVSQGIVSETTNKNTNKDLKNNTHTEAGVGVGSKFTIEECRRYAEHLRSTGQGINNPGGYATTIHRTGEADSLIESFLQQELAGAPSNLDAGQCPDCHGTGFYYPRGVEAGVARCRHEQLAKEGE
jgi:hypothetical protein